MTISCNSSDYGYAVVTIFLLKNKIEYFVFYFFAYFWPLNFFGNIL